MRFRSELVKNSITLLSANTLSQLIAIVVYPIVTRQYAPSDLGALSLLLSIVGICTILATGKYESAVLLEKEDSDAAAAFDLTIIINLVLCLLIGVLLLFFKPFLISVFQMESIASFVWFIPPMVFLAAMGFSATFWFNRQNRFRLSARYNISQSVTNNGLKIAFGAVQFTYLGLVLANLAGQIAGILSVFSHRKHSDGLFRFNKLTMKQIAVRHKHFPIYQMPHAFVNNLAGNLPILVLAAKFNMTEVGLFSLGITLGFRPINVLTSSVNQVFFQKVSANTANGIPSYTLLSAFSKKFFAIGLPVLIPLIFAVKPIAVFIFGQEWAGAGSYLQLMLPWFFFTVVASSLSFMPSVANKQKEAMFIEFTYMAFRFLALFTGIWFSSIHLSIGLFSAVSSVFMIGQTIWYLSLAKNLIKQ